MQRRTQYATALAAGIIATTLAAPPPATAEGAPMPVRAQAVTIAAGESHTLVIGADGRVYGAGNNEYDQLTRSQPTLTNLEPMAGLPSRVRAKAVDAGWGHSVVLGSDGLPYATGLNVDNQLTGRGDRSVLTAMTGLPSGVRATSIAAGSGSSFVTGSDGRPYGTGHSSAGELTGTKLRVRTLTPMTGLPSGVRAAAIVGGVSLITLVLGSDGVPYGTGMNYSGELTLRSETRRTLTPMVGLPSGVRATALAAGYSFSLVLGSDGIPYATGWNGRGQLTGTGDRDTLTPMVGLPEGVQATAVAAGFGHSLVLGSDGRVYATGENSHGQLTGADPGNRNVLIPMTGLPAGATVTEISAGDYFSVIRTSDGMAYGAGANDKGQLTRQDTADVTTLTVLTGQHVRAVRDPRVVGRELVGRTLHLDVGSYSPTPAGYSYSWYRNGIPVPHATGNTYTLTVKDWKKRLTARVIASHPHATLAAVYTPATAHVRLRLVPYGWPRISGTPRVGHVLTSAQVSWAVRGVKVHYRWFRGYKKIKGATHARYRVTRKDRGKKLRIRVTGTAPYAYSASRTSAAVTIRRH